MVSIAPLMEARNDLDALCGQQLGTSDVGERMCKLEVAMSSGTFGMHLFVGIRDAMKPMTDIIKTYDTLRDTFAIEMR
jgi:hypothetical protein